MAPRIPACSCTSVAVCVLGDASRRPCGGGALPDKADVAAVGHVTSARGGLLSYR